MQETCTCFQTPSNQLVTMKELGMDTRYAHVTLLVCPLCSQQWLRYHYELEAFTASGRWYLGAITAQQAEKLTVGNAIPMLEGLSWYFYGGSYYSGKIGKTSGKIF